MKGDVLGEAALVLHPEDTVATAIDDLLAGHELPAGEETVCLREAVDFGHKVALRVHDPGDDVYKYGEVVGRATERIEPGDWVHTHNCESTRGRGDLPETGAAAGGERA